MRTALTAAALLLIATLAYAADAYHVIPLKPDPAVAVDGSLDEWAEVPNAIVIAKLEQVHVRKQSWSGPEDLSATLQLAWRQEGIYIAADVRDSQVFQSQRSSMVYKGDHLEVFLDLRPDFDATRTTWGEGQYQFALSPGNFRQTGDPLVDVKPEVYCYRPEELGAAGTQIAAMRTAQGYIIEALIPFALMGVKAPHADQVLACEVALSDCDSQEPAQETYMTIGTERWHHSRERLQPMLLGDARGEATPPPTTSPIRAELQMDHNQKQDIEFQAPETPEGKAAYLFLRARIDSRRPAGYAPTVRVWLNREPIGGKRLTNRPRVSQYRAGKTMTFMTGEGLVALCYGPDFEATDKHDYYGLVDCKHSCEYELLVTDLLKPGANTLHIETRQDPRGKWRFVFGDIALLFKAPPPPERARRPAPTGEIPLIEPRLEFEKSYEVAAPDSAALRVKVANEAFEIQSQFSSPDGKWNRRSCDSFKHERRVEETIEGIVVFDTFTNLTDENLPLMQRHTCELKDRLKKVWLAGVSPYSQSGSMSQPANPTSFAVTQRAGIGLMAMNDEFQVHVANYCLDETLGLADNHFVLKPSASYTAEWMIVPIATTDFWDFVNTARRARDANFTLPYQFAFLSAREHTDDFLRNFIEAKSPDLVCASIGYPRYKGVYAHGTAFQHIDHSYYARHHEQLRKLYPKLKTSVYYHCFLDVLTDGDKIYADDRTLRPDGTQAIYGKPHDKIFLPTLTNKFGPETGKNIDFIFDQCGADGVYWDELAYSAYGYHYGEPWDGCSGDIDPKTFKLRRLKSSVTLVSLPFRVHHIKRIMARGPLLANGEPHTRTVARLKFQRFVETAAISHCLKAVLYSPVALGDHIGERTEEDAYRWMLAALNYGCVYNWYSEQVTVSYETLASYMFPITPMELHEGHIVGKERIVTNRSGMFGWGDASSHEVHVFNETGREVPDFDAPLVTRDGKTYTELRIAEDWSAAIIRKPAG